jgi:sulfatase modifying factor 1
MTAPASVSDFRLDKYEVSVERFRAFVDARMGNQLSPPTPGSGAHTKIPGSGWETSWNGELAPTLMALRENLACDSTYGTWTPSAAANERRPINCVSWFEAMAFCIWDGGYLPTEAEWNYAAAGGDQQRPYPWSAETEPLDGQYASYGNGVDCVGDNLPGCMLTDLAPVGSKLAGAGRWGQLDLAGNVAEWNLDWMADYITPWIDQANLTPDVRRVFRGGCFNNGRDQIRTPLRDNNAPSNRNFNFGFRCARAP